MPLIRQGLGAIYDLLDAAPTHQFQERHITEAKEQGEPHAPCVGSKQERIALEAKLIGLMLAARKDIILYPSSPREVLPPKSVKKNRHDAYRVVDGQKVAYAFIADNSDAPSKNAAVRRINLQTMLQQTEAAANPRDSRLRRLSAVGEFLRAEIRGEQLAPWAVDFLDGLNDRFVTKLYEEGPRLIVSGQETDEQSDLESVTWNPEQEAEASVRAYLRYGRPMNEERLRQHIAAMRVSESPHILATCIGACIDLANVARSPLARLESLAVAKRLGEKYYGR